MDKLQFRSLSFISDRIRAQIFDVPIPHAHEVSGQEPTCQANTEPAVNSGISLLRTFSSSRSVNNTNADV